MDKPHPKHKPITTRNMYSRLVHPNCLSLKVLFMRKWRLRLKPNHKLLLRKKLRLNHKLQSLKFLKYLPILGDKGLMTVIR